MDDFPADAVVNKGFAFRDLLGQDKWEAFTVTFTSLSIVGTPTYVGRWRVVGRAVEFQVTAIATTSIASTAGTTYFALPKAAGGIAGCADMGNRTTNVSVGNCVIDVTNSRCYLPSQAANGSLFSICGRYEA